MTSDLTIKKTALELDGFNNFTDEIEGDDSSNMSPRVIQGTRIKYLDPDWWIGEQKITGMLLTVINVLNVATKWGHDNKPLETQILMPGEKFPDFDKRNAECSDSEWRTAFGKEVGPWSGQHCLYLVDEHLNPYTWASPITTIGSAIAVRELVDQIKRVRRFKGSDVYPVVELGHTHFPNAYKPDRERPSLLPIKRLVRLGPDRTADVLPAPTTAALVSADNASTTITQDAPADASATPQGAPADAKTVAPISCAEELNDEIPW